MSKNELHPIVIDNGSEFIKAGLAGDSLPKSVFSSIVGRPKRFHLMIGQQERLYIGDDAENCRGILFLNHPIVGGIISDKLDMINVWQYTFYNQLRVAEKEHPILLTDPFTTLTPNKELMIQIMFETFAVPATYIANQALLSLYATGRKTGVVLESGYGISQVISVDDGSIIRDGVDKTDIVGQDLTNYMVQLLGLRGLHLTGYGEMQIVADIKEKMCYVADDYDIEINKKGIGVEKSYELPDGEEIVLKDERFKCPEVIFQPSLIGSDEKGIHEKMYDSVMNCNVEIRKNLFENVVLSGGNTMYPNLNKRLEKELNTLSNHSMKINVIEDPKRKYGAWIGGSIFASLISDEMWISDDDYNEYGPSILNKKCF